MAKEKSGRRSNDDLIRAIQKLENQFFNRSNGTSAHEGKVVEICDFIRQRCSEKSQDQENENNKAMSSVEELLTKYVPELSSSDKKDKRKRNELKKALNTLIDQYDPQLSAEDESIPGSLMEEIDFLVTKMEMISFAKEYEPKLITPEGQAFFAKKLSNCIHQAAIEGKYTEQEVAKRVGVTHTQIWKLKKGKLWKTTSPDKYSNRFFTQACYLRAFCILFDIPPHTFFLDNTSLVTPIEFDRREDSVCAAYIVLHLTEDIETRNRVLDLLTLVPKLNDTEAERITRFLISIPRIGKTEVPNYQGCWDEWRSHSSPSRELVQKIASIRNRRTEIVDIVARIVTQDDNFINAVCDIVNLGFLWKSKYTI